MKTYRIATVHARGWSSDDDREHGVMMPEDEGGAQKGRDAILFARSID